MKNFFYPLLLVLGVVFVASCCKDDEDPFLVNMKGEVFLSEASAYEGKNITVSIKNLAGLEKLTDKEYAGKPEYEVKVTYLLDGKSIGTSTSIADDFSVKYTVKNLSLGTHTITAEIRSGNGITLRADIKSANLNVETKSVDLTLRVGSSISEDLMDLVTPILTYDDAEGTHEIALSKDLYERSVTENEEFNLRFVRYRWGDELKLKLKDAAKMSLRYVEKNGATYDEAKRYDIDEGFSVSGYSYSYNGGWHLGTISNINININININMGDLQPSKDDHTYSAEQAKEYVRRLCTAPQKINVSIDKDGKLTINDKMY